jgi:nicotinic acid mononucleotide adenylyltransferase
MQLDIAIGGSSGNPTHLAHFAIVRFLLRYLTILGTPFHKVIWIPCGERPDKHFDVGFNHRIPMNELTLAPLRRNRLGARLEVRYDDVFGENTPTIEWLRRIGQEYPEAKLTWFTGSDSIVPREEFGGLNEIQYDWHEGEYLWACQQWNWLVIRRPGFEIEDEFQLPPNVQMVDCPDLPAMAASSLIRRMIAAGQPGWEVMVCPDVASYIKTHGLYGFKESK